MGDQVDVQTPPVEQPDTKQSKEGADVGKSSSGNSAEIKTIKIDDEDVPFTEEKFREGYMRNKDYTQGKQKLADDRKQFDSRLDYIQQKEAELAEREKSISTKQPQSDTSDAAIEKSLDLTPLDEYATDAEKANRKAIIRQERRYFENEAKVAKDRTDQEEKAKIRANEQILKEIEQVKKKYGDKLDMDIKNPDSDISEICDLAYIRGAPNLMEVADKYIEKLDKRKDVHIKTYLEGKENDKDKNVEKGTGGAPTSEPKDLKLGDGTARKGFLEDILKGRKSKG